MIVCSDATNNTTQFDNFTIEWEDFNILTCAVPMTVNVSSFSCSSRIGSIHVTDISCLEEVTIEFDQSTCQSSTTVKAPTTGFTTREPITSQPMTSASVQQTQVDMTGNNKNILLIIP